MSRRSAGAAVFVLALSLAVGASGPPLVAGAADAASRTGVSDGAQQRDRPAPCTRGTAAVDGLCVGRSAQARAAAALVQEAFRDRPLGAVVVGVWQDGKPQVVGALGESVPGVQPATVDMHHVAGNVCTPMLTTVLLQQVEAGTLALTDKLAKWFPDLPGSDAVTVDDLAHMTSGYLHYPSLPDFQTAFYDNPFATWQPEQLIEFGVPASGPQYPPGTDANFSDTNVVLLGHVLEAATQRSVPELLQEGIFDPLEMKDTVSVDRPIPEPVLHSYTSERGVWEEATSWNRTWTSWAGGCASNQEDIRKFLDALGSGALLSSASHALQLAPTTVGLGNNTPTRYYALGVPIVNGWVFTNPRLQGVQGAMGTLPGKGLTIIVYNTLTPAGDTEKSEATALMVALSKVFSPSQPAVPSS